MKTLFSLILLSAFATGPVFAHPGQQHAHTPYGVFWKNGAAPLAAHKVSDPEIWRFAFVSKFRW